MYQFEIDHVIQQPNDMWRTLLVQTWLYPPSPPPIMTSSLSTYAKATFLENAFPRKKSRRSRKPIFTVWFFYTLEVWRNFAQGLPFFPQRTIVWNHFWKSILISEITCIHDITYENGGSIYESLVKKPLQYSQTCKIKFHQFTNFQFKNSKFFHPNENQAQKMGHEWHSDL